MFFYTASRSLTEFLDYYKCLAYDIMLGLESLIASLIVSFPPVFDTVCINVVWTKPDELVYRVFA